MDREKELTYKEVLIEINKQFKKRGSGIRFEDASAGWERYKRKIKELNNGKTSNKHR